MFRKKAFGYGRIIGMIFNNNKTVSSVELEYDFIDTTFVQIYTRLDAFLTINRAWTL